MLDKTPVQPRTTASIVSYLIVGILADFFSYFRRYSEASEHLQKKCAIDRVVGLLQVDETPK